MPSIFLSDLYPFRHSKAELSAIGKLFDGGQVELLLDSDLPAIRLELRAGEFTTLALLMRRSLSTLTPESVPADAFIDRSELLASLKSLFGTTDPQVVTKGIHRLRERLREALHAIPHRLDGDPALSLIETQRIGYRISIPPERMRLYLLDEYRLGPDSTGRDAGPSRC